MINLEFYKVFVMFILFGSFSHSIRFTSLILFLSLSLSLIFSLYFFLIFSLLDYLSHFFLIFSITFLDVYESFACNDADFCFIQIKFPLIFLTLTNKVTTIYR
jgi:hypothetical protein